MIHPLFKINWHSAVDAARLPIKLKLLTGIYILQSKRIRMYKNENDPKCLLSAKEEENIEHYYSKLLKPQQSKNYYTSGDNSNFQHIRNWIWWTISQRITTTYFGRNSGSENKETLSSQCSRNRTPYSTPAISTSYSPLQNDLLLDEELVWIDYIFNC